MPSAKIGVIYQNDAFGKNYYAGLRVGLGAKKSQIVSAQSYDPGQTTLTQQILALKAAGADTLVIFALPTQTIVSLATAAKVGWTPTVFVGNVSGNRLFMLAAANGANVNGVISTNYLDSSTDPTLANTAGVKLANDIINTYAPSLLSSYQKGDANVMYGLAQGWTIRLRPPARGQKPDAGKPRQGVQEPEHDEEPVPVPGIKLQTSAKDNFPIEQEIMIKWAGGSSGDWQSFGELISHVR